MDLMERLKVASKVEMKVVPMVALLVSSRVAKSAGMRVVMRAAQTVASMVGKRVGWDKKTVAMRGELKAVEKVA